MELKFSRIRGRCNTQDQLVSWIKKQLIQDFFINLATTLLVLVWAGLLSLCWALVVFWLFRKSRLFASSPQFFLLPALVVSPLFIIAGFGLLGINLIFPPQLSMSSSELILYCALPAVVLFFASGLGFEIFELVRAEYRHIRGQQFYLFARALGQPVDRITSRVVITKGLIDAWVKCLPWFFGELVVVEAMFNAPGLGYHSWMYARMQNLGGMTISIIWLVGIYILLAAGAGYYSRWIGQRLESYH